MLALAWQWADGARRENIDFAKRLGASLCAGIGGHAGTASHGPLNFAYRPLKSSAAQSRAWQPASLHSGRMVLFHGYFDNCTAVAAELQANAADHAHLYGLAVERWGDEADTRIIGEYCAVIADPDQHHLRLSRSPLRAPPLCYFHDERLAAAASVPRALFAVGVDQKLSDRRIGDTALVNFTDREDSWFEGIRRVPTGAIVELQRGRERTLRTYYDLFALPDVRMGSDAEYLARAGELLDEGVRACLAGFKRPGTTLSAGLDTPQVAARTLAALPEDQRLPSFTFHPEDGYDGREEPLTLGNERPFVERFAAMHPRLEPHFTANEGYGHDHRWNDFFHLMSGAPTGLSNMYVFHGIFAEAVKAGCDVLLLAEWGNYTFSDKGDWGYVEYFLKGNFRQWWRAISSLSRDDRSLPAHIAARTLSALLPRSLWKLGKRLYRRGGQSLLDLMQPLSPQFRESSGADSRLKASGWEIERYQPWNRRHAQRLLFQMDDAEAAEIYQAFEQMYGVAQRDPMAYRPFVEFCFGLPVKMFMRDGIVRWMAKEMAKGIMPEEQRANAANGRWDADWHLRIGRQRQAYLAELDRLEADERIGPMLDIPRLRANLVDWPDQTEVDPQQVYGREFAVPRALLIARFVRYIEGRNDG